jgi:hypothetical protein
LAHGIGPPPFPRRRAELTTAKEHRINARKYAWQILHAEIRRGAGTNKGLDLDPQLQNIGVLLRKAEDEGLSPIGVILELAGFGAMFARFFAETNDRNVTEVAADIGRDVMAEPDDDNDDGHRTEPNRITDRLTVCCADPATCSPGGGVRIFRAPSSS